MADLAGPGKCSWMVGLPSATGVGNGRATSLEASAPPHPLTFTNTGKLEKPDLTVVFYTDIAASCVPVYANQTWSFLHMILSTGPQSSEPSYQ